MTLEEVRDAAREKLKGRCGVFKICDGAKAKPCQNQSYGGSIGLGGVGSGSAFSNNFSALEAVRLRMRVVGPHITPDTHTALFGRKIAMPVLGASVSGVKSFGEPMTEEEFCRDVVLGCADAGTVGFRGDTFTYSLTETPGLDAIAEAKGVGVKICKPREQSVLLEWLARTEEAGALAVGVDVDGCGSTIMAKNNKPVFRKSVRELQELVKATRLPFIVKGVMTVEEAHAAVDAGAAALVVSNHGGRVLDHTPGTAEVLPAIAEAVGGEITVLADGGVRTGFDALKMLALGAKAVLVGRDIIRAAVGAGREGVRIHMEHMQKSLAKAMLMTGCRTLGDISSEMLER
jgi:isopentenyl diphosphate isomerase/L-lactate dehydrogenase-like FMN-dependent dehydrogenase